MKLENLKCTCIFDDSYRLGCPHHDPAVTPQEFNMLAQEYYKSKVIDAAKQLAVAVSIRVTAEQNPYSDYHVNAMMHEMECEKAHLDALTEYDTLNKS